MAETVLFESESARSRSEIAAALRDVADKLDGGDPVTFAAGDENVTVDPPASPTFEIKVERETGSGPDEMSFELEVEWDKGDGADADGDLRIE
ncbi:amphi-Trp domain-containing protein [Halostella pelagica]|uniref:amphi-Trp domain-containing protein n=1 Tax=Halostella pelagica TaxID=2583824 RepID=UPI00108089E3|nr:amphi-Trp domain-containing protein [Halostella pelagica]